MKKETIISLFLIVILILNVFYLVTADENENRKKYYNKLIESGLTKEQANRVIDKYKTEEDLREAIKQAKKDERETILKDISIKKLEKEFYLPESIAGLFKEYLEKTKNKVNSFLKDVFGGTVVDLFSWIIGWKKSGRLGDLMVGIVAWLILLVTYWLTGSFLPKRIPMEVKEDKYSKFKNKYLKFIAGRWFGFWWGGIIFVLGYFFALQIPLLNRFIEIITFYHLTPFWLRPVVLAIIIGYLPAICRELLKYRKMQRDEEKIQQARTAARIAKIMGR